MTTEGWKLIAKDRPYGELFYHEERRLKAVRSKDLGRWHLSVSHKWREPTWDDLGFARDSLLPPEVFFMIPHPPRRFWLNLHPFTLHLWEMRDPELIGQFRAEGVDAQRLGVGTPS